MEKEILASFRAATAQPDYLTTEKLDSVLGGFGTFNLGVWAACNVIGKEIKKGKKINVTVKDEIRTEIDDIAKKTVKVLMDCGADGPNAALVAATLLYWAGSSVTAGIPAPNRKLGAVCRMAAGVPASRVANIPTEKLNNKISGFAAVKAIYEALDNEILSPWPGSIVPMGVAGSPLTGHTRIGEDLLFPELAKKLVKVGIDGMMKAYDSVGIKPCRWMSSLMACAATLEIIHPDAYVAEEYGPFLKTRSPYVCGLAAVEAANMPEKIHIRGTGEELETAKVIGDLAMILKDCGQPTVVGMIMFNEACGLIKEGAALGVGRSGGPLLLPLNHWCTSATLSLYLLGKGKEDHEVADAVKIAMDDYFQPEHATVATNILARRAHYIVRGPVTKCVMLATEPTLTKEVIKRCELTYNGIKNGKSVTDITRDLETQRLKDIGDGVARIFSKVLNKNIEYIKFLNVRPGSGRRSHKFALRYFAFDGYVDVECKVDGKVYNYKNVMTEAIPDALLAQDMDKLEIIECFAAGLVDMLNAGACAMDVVVPACVAAVMGLPVQDAVDQTCEGATISMSIPVPTMYESADLAVRIFNELE
ncbi:MAG: hypothetical protein ACOWWR_02030 [Eubacteriales bacterium]